MEMESMRTDMLLQMSLMVDDSFGHGYILSGPSTSKLHTHERLCRFRALPFVLQVLPDDLYYYGIEITLGPSSCFKPAVAQIH